MIGCPKCKTPIRTEQFNTTALTLCDNCGTWIQAELFSAMFESEQAPVDTGAASLEEGGAGCFFHPGNPASVPCASCGRFLCDLCDVEMEGKHLCFQCLGAGEKNGKIEKLEKHRVLYDRLALSLALYPILFIFPTIFTAPAALYIAIRYFKKPGSILPRTRIRFILAMIFAAIQIVFWVFAFWAMFN